MCVNATNGAPGDEFGWKLEHRGSQAFPSGPIPDSFFPQQTFTKNGFRNLDKISEPDLARPWQRFQSYPRPDDRAPSGIQIDDLRAPPDPPPQPKIHFHLSPEHILHYLAPSHNRRALDSVHSNHRGLLSRYRHIHRHFPSEHHRLRFRFQTPNPRKRALSPDQILGGDKKHR